MDKYVSFEGQSYVENSQSVCSLGISEVEGTFEVTELGPLQVPPLLDKRFVNCLLVSAYVLPLNPAHPISGQF